MAHANTLLIDALRETARRLSAGAEYAWGNHGTCNCGNLLQVMTAFDGSEIRRRAQTGCGEWTELAEEYCGVTDLPVDALVGMLMVHGLTATDIHHIEYLDDRDVLERLPGGFRWLTRNVREDVVLYLDTMADMLEERLQSESLRKVVRDILEARPAQSGEAPMLEAPVALEEAGQTRL